MISQSEFLDIFKNELDDQAISSVSQFKTLKKWSSLMSIIVINEIETKTGIILSVDDIMHSTTIAELYNRLASYEKV